MSGRLARALGQFAAAAPAILLVLLIVVCVGGSWRAIATIDLRIPFDPNEGWNAYHAVAAMAGRSLYPDARSYMVDNYPPLSFYFVGAIGRLTGDAIVAGRIVSMLSFFAIAAGVARASQIMGCRAIECALASLLFMSCLLLGSDYVGIDDPQLLGHALGVAGMILVLQEPRAHSVVWGAALLVTALFVKHNLLAQPLALGMWLFLYDRRNFWRFAAAGAALSLAGLMVFRLGFGTDLLSHLASPRRYAFGLLANNVGHWLDWGAVPLAILAALFAVHGRDRNVAFCALYAAISLVLGVAFAGGAGVDTNVFFDADIALALGCALAFDRFAKSGVLWPAFVAFALAVPLAAGVYLVYDDDWRDPDFWFHPMADDAAVAHDDIVFLMRHRGRAMCETLALCYWAGKTAEIDMFNTQQQFLTHARSDDGLVRAIAARRFVAVQIDTFEPFTLTPRIRAALLRAYRIDHSDDDGVFLVPR